ncbi:MAG: vWA domain-containing protein [Myxococcota bacterium]
MRIVLLSLLAACTPEAPSVAPVPETPTPPPGVDPGLRTEIVVQAPAPPVDVLFVVDNSSSMGDEQEALAASFSDFVDAILESGLDYHIGVVATDVQREEFSGNLVPAGSVRFIDTQTPQPFEVFSEMIGGLGTIVGSVESGRAAAWLALEANRDTPPNLDFLRPDASLHLVFISDAPDQSGAYPVTKAEFIAWGEALKPQADLVGMHAIVTVPGDPACLQPDRVGFNYIEYAQAFGGNVNSICTPEWTPLYTHVAVQAARLRTEFPLLEEPDIPSIAVSVVMGAQTRDYQVCDPGSTADLTGCEVLYDGLANAVRFEEPAPAVGSEVHITYAVAP